MTSRPDTSASPLRDRPRWAAWWPAAPRIVAESLARSPIRSGRASRRGPAGRRRGGGARARAEPARRRRDPSRRARAGCCRGRLRSFRRALAALERYGGALLADPVGSGKTYVALAVGRPRCAGRRPTACLVPAALADQWRARRRARWVCRSRSAPTSRRAEAGCRPGTRAS